eukprot:TRINITY_DN2056_c0_g2_i1.p1 TRINITY_DN2056_c0_g2~~TRINITY_DN2056_c0_g2_i1.p1  ORF type:complete len:164 (-),score=40.32 TRINITY_DN2056_c0_g2_i1:21-512(-)
MADKLTEGRVNKPKAIPLQTKLIAQHPKKARNHYFASANTTVSLHIALARISNLQNKDGVNNGAGEVSRNEKRASVPMVGKFGCAFTSLSNYVKGDEECSEEDKCSVDSEDHILTLPFPLKIPSNRTLFKKRIVLFKPLYLSLIHICRCRRYAVCRSRWSPYH